MATARFYDESKNEEGATFPGVPLADVSEAEWELLPAWIQASVDASPSYRKTKPDTASRSRAKSSDAAADKES